MPVDRYAARRSRLLKVLKSQEIAALLVTTETNVSYLTGFSGDSTYLLIGKGRLQLVSDSRYTVQLQNECPGIDAVIRPQTQTLPQATAAVLASQKLANVSIEADSLTVSQLETLQSALRATTLVNSSAIVEQLRQIKDAGELQEIRDAVRQAENAFWSIQKMLRPEQTELEVAHDLEHAMRRLGAQGASFPPIIAVGPNAALPHARPGTARIGDSPFVLFDWGATSAGGYRSDITRFVPTGNVSAKMQSVHAIVLKAQQAAIAAMHPGVRCRDVDAAARKVIEQAGYGKQFGHGLGHGIGLDIHELPRMNVSSETLLEPGMVVTVEPGIYLEGVGGVRLEDDVLILPDGIEVLSHISKDLADLAVV